MIVYLKGRSEPSMDVVTDAEDKQIPIPAGSVWAEVHNTSTQSFWYSFSGVVDTWIKVDHFHEKFKVRVDAAVILYLRKPYKPSESSLYGQVNSVALDATYTTAIEKTSSDQIIKLDVSFT
jgi:hypothetical protein